MRPADPNGANDELTADYGSAAYRIRGVDADGVTLEQSRS
jgi:hypothetical protein